MITSRPYRDQTDLQRLINFLFAQRAYNPVQGWHVGDLVWRLLYSSHFDPGQNVRLWENDGTLVGFGWRYPPNGVNLTPGDFALLPEMLAWATSGVAQDKFYLAQLNTERDVIAYLESHGFKRSEVYGFYLRRTLAGDLPHSTLPRGFTLRPVTGESEAAARAELHRVAFGTQNVTDDGYRAVMRVPQYQPELDLMVIAPDGRLAAFCLGWLDESNRVALFEPVGTHPDFRRMGLARAVMLEAMRRMQMRGMEFVLVATRSDNVASMGLYRSLGFTVESDEVIYSSEQ